MSSLYYELELIDKILHRENENKLKIKYKGK
jgi:hypothetical protein